MPNPLSYDVLSGQFSDISSAGTVYFCAPYAGFLRSCQVTLNNAITVADSSVTFKVDNVSVGTALTIAYTSSAKGTTFNKEFTGVPVKKGSIIEVISDGGATTTCIAPVTITVSP